MDCDYGTDCTDCGNCSSVSNVTPPPSSSTNNSCKWAYDGYCDEGDECEYGTDCSDCGTCSATGTTGWNVPQASDPYPSSKDPSDPYPASATPSSGGNPSGGCAALCANQESESMDYCYFELLAEYGSMDPYCSTCLSCVQAIVSDSVCSSIVAECGGTGSSSQTATEPEANVLPTQEPGVCSSACSYMSYCDYPDYLGLCSADQTGMCNGELYSVANCIVDHSFDCSYAVEQCLGEGI